MFTRALNALLCARFRRRDREGLQTANGVRRLSTSKSIAKHTWGVGNVPLPRARARAQNAPRRVLHMRVQQVSNDTSTVRVSRIEPCSIYPSVSRPLMRARMREDLDARKDPEKNERETVPSRRHTDALPLSFSPRRRSRHTVRDLDRERERERRKRRLCRRRGSFRASFCLSAFYETPHAI